MTNQSRRDFIKAGIAIATAPFVGTAVAGAVSAPALIDPRITPSWRKNPYTPQAIMDGFFTVPAMGRGLHPGTYIRIGDEHFFYQWKSEPPDAYSHSIWLNPRDGVNMFELEYKRFDADFEVLKFWDRTLPSDDPRLPIMRSHMNDYLTCTAFDIEHLRNCFTSGYATLLELYPKDLWYTP